MTTTSRMILSAALGAIAVLTSVTAAFARPIPVVPASNPSVGAVDPAAAIAVGSSPLWQFAVVALVAALVAAAVTHLAEARSAHGSGLDVSQAAG